MEIDIWGTEENKITPQPFNLMIILSIADIIFSYGYQFLPAQYTWCCTIFTLALEIAVMTFFKKYLQNFKASRAIHWVKRDITITILLLAYSFIAHLIPATVLVSFSIINIVIPLSLLAISLGIKIALGNNLRLIHNDFIGLLKELGFCFSYVVPGVTVFAFIVTLLPLYSATDAPSGYYNVALRIIQITALLMPAFFMTGIFVRANKFVQETNKLV